MAILIDASTPSTVTQPTGTIATLSTGSFTPPAGSDLAILWGGNTIDPNNPATPTITDNLGVPLSYTLNQWVSHADSPNANGQAAIWTAHVATSQAMTITVTSGAASPNRHAALSVMVLTGCDPVTPFGTSGKSSSKSQGTFTQNFTATRTGSWGFMTVLDWTVVGVASAGTGCTTISAAGVGAPDIDYIHLRRSSDDGVNGASTAMNVTMAGTSTDLSWAWIEAIPDLGSTPDNPTLHMLPPFLNGKMEFLVPWWGTDSNVATPTQTVNANSIVDDSATGELALTVGQVTISAFGVQSEEREGEPTLTATITVPQTGIQSEERSGVSALSNVVSILPAGINTEERIGVPTVTPGDVTLAQTGIQSEERSGFAAASQPSANISFDTSGNNFTASSTTSLSIDITTAAVGATAYALLDLGTSQSGGTVTWTGWTQVLEGDEGTATHYALYKRTKISGDTTFTISWTTATRGVVVWSSYNNVSGDELAQAQLHTTSGTTYPTPSLTPGGTGRWALDGTWSRSTTSANQTESYTNDAALTERQDVNNGANPWCPTTIADSNGTVTVAAHSYTATMTTTGSSASESHGGAILLYLVPSTAAAQTVNATGIQSEEHIGAAAVEFEIATTGNNTEERVGSAAVEFAIAANGINTEERSGASTVTSIATVSATGIVTEERSGASSVSNVSTISPSGIPHTDRIGEPTLSSTATVAPVGIFSAEASGSSRIDLYISASGISGAEALGNASVSNVNSALPEGIFSEERVGEPTVTSTATITASGISAAEGVGVAQVLAAQIVTAAGIVSEEREGTATLTPGAVTLTASGISTEERVATPSVNSIATIAPTGVSSGEAFGAPTVLLVQTISPTGVYPGETSGSSRIDQVLVGNGIASESNLGNPSATLFLTATGVPSFERVGSPSVLLAQTVAASGVPSAEQLGFATLLPGPVTLSPTAVSSEAGSGAPTVGTASIVSATGVVSSEVFGTPVLLTATTVSVAGIPSADGIGSPSLLSQVTLQAQGITSAQALGQISLATLVRATGIGSAETLGRISITVGAVTIAAYGIATQERHGRISVTAVPVVAPPPDTTVQLLPSLSKIKIVQGTSVISFDVPLTKVKIVNGQTVIMLDEGTVIEVD